MALTNIIDQIHALVDSGTPASNITPLLITLHDQAAALELRLQAMDTKLHDSISYADYEVVVAEGKKNKEDADRFRAAYQNLLIQNEAAQSRDVAPGLQGMPVPFQVRHLHDRD